jgi:hypothetical protein
MPVKYRLDADDEIINPLINGVRYNWPGSQGAPGSWLRNDGNGNLVWTIELSRARARLGVDQSIPDSTYTVLALNVTDFDGLGEYDAASYRFTALSAGYYQVNASVKFAGASGGARFMEVRRNGTTVLGTAIQNVGDVYYRIMNCSDVVYLNAGDYLEVYVWQSSGAVLSVVAEAPYTFFSVHRLS